MPNWCSNSITIQGPTDTIKQLWEDACNNAMRDPAKGLLDAMVPIGEWDYGNAVEAWGTKWDISLEGLEFEDNGDGTAYITGWFDTAWAPPVEAYNTFLEDMDNCSLEASYYEPGMDFGGFWSSENGDEYFDDLQERLEQPVEEWDERFAAFEQEYDLLSEEHRFEEEEMS